MNHLVIAPLLLPLLAGIVLLLLRPLPLSQRRLLSLAAVLALVVMAIMLLLEVADGSVWVYALGNWPAPYGIVLVLDRLAALMLLTTSLLALFALLYACRGTDLAGRHFHVLFQLQLFGLNGAFLTGDLFNLFVFFEVLLLASYGLLLHGSGKRRTRAGLHFVVINLAGSTLFLFAVGTLYGVLGSLNMADLAVRLEGLAPADRGVAEAAGLLLFVVFALKAALIPLHLWLPAAYASTSAPVAALFAIMTKVGAYAILRLDTLIFGAGAGASAHLLDPWLLPLALATLAIGMLGAIASTALRQQLAYLVVASVGSLLVAFGLGTEAAIAAGLYYLPHSTFAAGAFFLLADSIVIRRGDMDDRFQANAAMTERRLLGGYFFVLAVITVGLPPLSGFLGKFLTLRAALGHPAEAWVFAVVLGGGLLGLIALARSGSVMFYRAYRPAHALKTPGSRLVVELAPLSALVLLSLAMTVWAEPIHRYALDTAEQLLGGADYIRAVLPNRGGLQ
ncbi:MAG: monovalent cation/H+ antiporter subunit D [Gammaproteobacteria bacterium]|nr:monovalent cation/H+ antiporter subunit D [Gammaproteobacteria bacterium]